MTQLHDTTESIKEKHLTADEQAQIAILKQEKYANRQIAGRLDRVPQTINNEINRGTVQQLRRHMLSLFQTITSDNGTEFSELYDTLKTVTDVYFARPFASYERGTSENQHKLTRRFIPKGQPISDISDRQIQRIQRWMNDYPRKILDYQTPHECFAKAFNQIQTAQSA